MIVSLKIFFQQVFPGRDYSTMYELLLLQIDEKLYLPS